MTHPIGSASGIRHTRSGARGSPVASQGLSPVEITQACRRLVRQLNPDVPVTARPGGRWDLSQAGLRTNDRNGR